MMAVSGHLTLRRYYNHIKGWISPLSVEKEEEEKEQEEKGRG